MAFVCIQNPGVAPAEGFTLLGVSTTRGCGVEGTIGQFGSGTKHAVNVLLRAGLKVTVYCGKTRLDFQTRDDEIDDGLVRKPVQRVICKLGGTSSRTIDLGWVLDFGAIDWTDLSMALREFVSNAIDRTVREENGEFYSAIQDGRLAVTVVDDNQVRARDGYTRVFVECNDRVQQFVNELPKRFLHFSDHPAQVKQSLLSKSESLSGRPAVLVYRAGVFVREIGVGETSVYDYNLKPEELEIDECRNSSDYATKAAIARLYRKATAKELVPVFGAMVKQVPVFEDHLDPHYICPSWETPKGEQKANWQQAWHSVAADAVVCGPTPMVAEFARRKGHAVAVLRTDTLPSVAERFGLTTVSQVLTENEKNGHEKLPPTEAAQAAVDEVWSWLEALNMTNGQEKPAVGCFRDVMSAGSQTLGFCDDTGVYFADDHASGLNKALLATVLEECIHWVTKAKDGSRDLQDFAFRLIVEVLA